VVVVEPVSVVVVVECVLMVHVVEPVPVVLLVTVITIGHGVR